MNIDFIGDVHGYLHLLEKLLVKLDYTKSKGSFAHPIQKTIFVGDIINRGPDVKGALKLVYNMCESGQARCVLGNHEINLLAYNLHKTKKFLSNEQVIRIEKQLETTFLSFKNDAKELQFYTDWLKTFPIYIEENGFRVIHACWIKKAVKFVNKNYRNNLVTDDLIVQLMNIKSKEYGLLHSLFQGVDIPYFKGDLKTKSTPVRIRWWNSMEGKTYRDMATKERQHISLDKIPSDIVTDAYQYPEKKPLLFIGHFCLDELPNLDSKNVCCLDFCVSKKGILTSYRLLAETKLKPEHLYYVYN